ncbi:DsrE family protein [Archangium sp.]|uniref:DsrE family protein n=1 Tax=Archangium sp. TaxID=1872627 RepID=UPI00286AFD53|nr:DsrE family protein [Archangium sp.]
MRTHRALFAVLALLVGLNASAASPASAPVKTVYHLSDGLEQATQALRYIRNHLAADPKAKIVVVAHASGVDFLLEGTEDKNKNPYNVAVEDLSMQGVEFRVCELTLQSRSIDKGKLLPEAKVVPSGVAEIARLQAREGYAYIRP